MVYIYMCFRSGTERQINHWVFSLLRFSNGTQRGLVLLQWDFVFLQRD